jgi:hypothetical protein
MQQPVQMAHRAAVMLPTITSTATIRGSISQEEDTFFLVTLEILSELVSQRVKAEDKMSNLANLSEMAVSPALAHSLAP